jgi:hypothetical protein
MEKKIRNLLNYFGLKNWRILEYNKDNVGVDLWAGIFYFDKTYFKINKEHHKIFKNYFKIFGISFNKNNVILNIILHEIGHIFHNKEKDNGLKIIGELEYISTPVSNEIEYRSLDKEQFADVFALEYMEQRLEELKEVMEN